MGDREGREARGGRRLELNDFLWVLGFGIFLGLLHLGMNEVFMMR